MERCAPAYPASPSRAPLYIAFRLRASTAATDQILAWYAAG